VEALVAFVILAFILAGLLTGISGAARNDDRADFIQRTARLAQSKLDELGVTDPLVIGESSGQFDDGATWDLSIEPYEIATSNGAQRSVISAYWAYLTVTRAGSITGRSQTFTLVTVKVIAPHRPAKNFNPDTL
jgi:type II secretory pathway pseudopilin PulG